MIWSDSIALPLCFNHVQPLVIWAGGLVKMYLNNINMGTEKKQKVHCWSDVYSCQTVWRREPCTWLNCRVQRFENQIGVWRHQTAIQSVWLFYLQTSVTASGFTLCLSSNSLSHLNNMFIVYRIGSFMLFWCASIFFSNVRKKVMDRTTTRRTVSVWQIKTDHVWTADNIKQNETYFAFRSHQIFQSWILQCC